MRTPRLLGACVTLLFCASAIARDGDLDPSFGLFGKDRIALSGSSYVFHGGAALALQPDGKLLIAGTRFTLNNNLYDYDLCVVRLLPNGLLDATFGNAGETDVPINRAGGDNDDDLSDMLLQSDGKILLVGYASGDATTGKDIVAVRLNSDGGNDGTYGNNGKSFVPYNLGASLDDYTAAATLDSQGRLLISGYSTTTGSSTVLTLTRLDTNGNRDVTFSADGRVTYAAPAGKAPGPARVRELANHQILVSGYLLDSQSVNADMLLLRYNADGTPDASFGNGGAATYAFDIGGNLQDAAIDFAELSDGTLLATGFVTVNAPSNTDVALMKFSADGAPYPGFTPRTYPLDLGGSFSDFGTRIALDAQGRIVIAGLASTGVVNGNNLTDFVVLRALPDGSLDTAFGTNGRVVRSSAVLFAPDIENSGAAMLLDSQGRIVIAGTSAYTSADPYKHVFAALRFIDDTVFDDAFGP